jgi:hypothetical protein
LAPEYFYSLLAIMLMTEEIQLETPAKIVHRHIANRALIGRSRVRHKNIQLGELIGDLRKRVADGFVIGNITVIDLAIEFGFEAMQTRGIDIECDNRSALAEKRACDFTSNAAAGTGDHDTGSSKPLSSVSRRYTIAS